MNLQRRGAALILAGLLSGAGAPAPAMDPAEAVDAVQKRYENTTSLKARFQQKSYLKVMGQTQQAQGDVLIKKPGKMKWTYFAPDPQVLVSNQETLWLYLPKDKQVTKMKIESVYSSNTPALFLAGRGKLTEAFNIGQVLEKETTFQITLFPKEPENNIDRLVLVADKKNYQIVGSTVYDKLGNRTEMRFSDIQINPRLPDEVFRFAAPPGVEVIDFSASRP